jgi:hypothetical protein
MSVWGEIDGVSLRNRPTTQTKRVSYVITADDVAAGFAAVPVAWDIPFDDLDYNINFSVHDTDQTVDLSFFCGDFHNKTVDGFDAVVYTFSPGAGDAGVTVVINATAIHD